MNENDKTAAREIGKRIIAARKEFEPGPISQQELADLIHVSQRSMQAYEAGEVIPYRKLKDIAAVLNKPAAWILHGERASDPVGELAVLQDISVKMDRIISLFESRAA